jgi:hypothetical protein
MALRIQSWIVNGSPWIESEIGVLTRGATLPGARTKVVNEEKTRCQSEIGRLMTRALP